MRLGGSPSWYFSNLHSIVLFASNRFFFIAKLFPGALFPSKRQHSTAIRSTESKGPVKTEAEADVIHYKPGPPQPANNDQEVGEARKVRPTGFRGSMVC